MTTWNGSDLDRIGAAEELDLQSERDDGTLRAPVTMWVVRAGDDIYIRSVKGADGPWYRGRRPATRARRSRRGPAGSDLPRGRTREYAAVDAAYREKYGHYTSIVEHVLTEQARTSTLRLEPR
ncbi:DUF2255 family protein [Streptomyces sp. M10(2022)]